MFCAQVICKKLTYASSCKRNCFRFAVLFLMVFSSLRLLFTKTHWSPRINQLLTSRNTDHVNSSSSSMTLSRSATRQYGNPSKVIILTYERSGSTLMGEMFNQNHDAFYWFEPLHDSLFWYWNNGSLRSQEENVKIIENILNCRFQQLPVEIHIDMFILEQSQSQRTYKTCIMGKENMYPLLYHCRMFLTSSWPKRLKIESMKDWIETKLLHSIWVVLKKYTDSLTGKVSDTLEDKFVTEILKTYQSTGVLDLDENKTYQLLNRLRDSCSDSAKFKLTDCIEQLEGTCKKATIRSVKTIRLEMKYVEQLMKSERELKIIHLVRDPRAVLQSRIQVRKDMILKDGYPTNFDLKVISNQMCTSILQDVEAAENFRTFSVGSPLQINYEDMINGPEEVLDGVYKFLNISVNAKVRKWLWNTMHAKKDNGPLGTARKDPRDHISKWKKVFSAKAIKEIDDSCQNLYLTVGYRRFSAK